MLLPGVGLVINLNIFGSKISDSMKQKQSPDQHRVKLVAANLIIICIVSRILDNNSFKSIKMNQSDSKQTGEQKDVQGDPEGWGGCRKGAGRRPKSGS